MYTVKNRMWTWFWAKKNKIQITLERNEKHQKYRILNDCRFSVLLENNRVIYYKQIE